MWDMGLDTLHAYKGRRIVLPMTYSESTYLTTRAIASTLVRDSKRDGGMRVHLTDVQGGRCADCGKVSTDMEFAHIHRSPGVFAPGLGVMTCRDCNIIHTMVADENGSLPYAYVMGMAILPQTDLPSRAECVRLHAEHTATVHAERVAEASRRMAERGL